MIKSFAIGIFLFVSSMFCGNMHAQQKKNASQTHYEEGVAFLQNGDYDGALNKLLAAYQEDPKDFNVAITIGNTYREMKQYDSSLLFYEKAKALDGKQFQGFNMNYSVSLAGMGRFPDALATVNQYLSNPNLSARAKNDAQYRQKTYLFAIDYTNKHPNKNYTFSPVNMGDAINSPNSEYYPSFTIDDSMFVYTRRGEGLREDFMQSFRLPDGSYTQAVLMPDAINDQPAKGAIDISQDGQWVIFAGNFPGKGLGDFDLYISYKTDAGWTDPQNLGRSINTEYWESSPSLSPDKHSLYFSSNRPSGYGGNDLYVSHLMSDGKWSKAQNLGAVINTRGDELAPLIHADNETLFYTSSGQPGYGGTDLFMSKRIEGDKWGTPQNLGYPVNTIDNEGSLFVAADGVTAYYASDRSDSRGELDLYRFQLPPDLRPLKTLYVSGKITDATQTYQGLEADIVLTDNQSQKQVSESKSSINGNYLVTLPAGRDYTFTAKKKGYLFQSELFELSKEKSHTTVHKDMVLHPIQMNASITLKNILFATNSYKLEPISLIELHTVLQLMQDNPTLRLRINGHTDNKGTQSINQPLSANRAKAVAEYLVTNGVAQLRLEWKGFGDAKPVADNGTDEGRQLNRRTEVEVIGY